MIPRALPELVGQMRYTEIIKNDKYRPIAFSQRLI